MGTTMPLAPASSAYLICHPALSFAHAPVAGMRTIVLGASGPSPATACTISPAPGWRPIMPCSQSMATQERWGEAEAAARALRAPGGVSHAPKAGLEVRKAWRRGWASEDIVVVSTPGAAGAR